MYWDMLLSLCAPAQPLSCWTPAYKRQVSVDSDLDWFGAFCDKSHSDRCKSWFFREV